MLLRFSVRQVSFLHVYHHATITLIWWFITFSAPGGDGKAQTLTHALSPNSKTQTPLSQRIQKAWPYLLQLSAPVPRDYRPPWTFSPEPVAMHMSSWGLHASPWCLPLLVALCLQPTTRPS